MAWRLAGSLKKLRDQVNAKYPNRSKASDGTIGDPAHKAEGTGSDHNPNNAGVVCALDITHDPANGVDIDRLSDALAASRDPRIKYLIANGLILVPADWGWQWMTYTGSNPHTSHLHVSVYGDYDNDKEWNIGEEDMAEKANLTTMRILNAGIFGHNGLAGRQNALTGSEDAHLDVGMELTNEKILAMFYDERARQWRDSQTHDSLFGINQSLAELKKLRTEVEKLKKQPVDSSEAEKKLDDLRTALKNLLEIK